MIKAEEVEEVKTFVIGAGASEEFKFPTSFTLVADIVSCLNSVIRRIEEREIYSYSLNSQSNILIPRSIKTEVITVTNCIKFLSCKKNLNGVRINQIDENEVDEYKNSAILLKNKLRSNAITIDNLLSRPETSEKERLLAKIVIAAIIKCYEKKSALYSNKEREIAFDNQIILLPMSISLLFK